ncbi:MAG: S8 family serine peptidase [Pseudomonadota bacterium]
MPRALPLALCLLALGLATPALAEAPAPAIDPTWDRGDDLQPYLVGLVTEKVRAELAIGAPGFDLDRLATYIADPRQLPARLGGRAGDALWLYLPVLLASGDLAQAQGLVELLRNPDANLNPKVIHHGALTYAELLRAQAGSERAQLQMIQRVLGQLPPSRFLRTVSTLDTLAAAAEQEAGADLPQMWASSLANMQTYPATPENASAWLARRTYNKGWWDHIALYTQAEEALRPIMEQERARRKPHVFATVDMEQHVAEAHPVVVGIMDSGVNPLRFNMYENPGERADGLDNDGNGTVDDLYGLVWDWDPAKRQQHGNLDLVEQLPPAQVQEFEPYIVGNYQRRTGHPEAPEAQAVTARLTSLSSVEEQKAYSKAFGEVGEWAHGSHVAGLAVAGNRWARIAAFRLAWTGEGRIYFERGPSDQELRWERQSILELVAWVNAQHVQVINASLGFTVEYQEAALAKERDVFDPGFPAYAKLDAEGRKTHELDLAAIHTRAEQIQAHRRESWRLLFDGCPDTLFVLAAGNEDHDITEFMDVPTTIPVQHDNLLVVGAVDSDGEWATFTNFNPALVQVYDLGVDVWSTSPTGRMIPMSGTSMAAPNATDTAAKLLSLYPELTPAQIRQVLITSADPLPKPYSGGIIDEPAAVAAAAKLVGR